MEFDSVVRGRRMVRDYDPDRPVPDEVVQRLLEYAIRAPSAGFAQGWGFLVLAEPEDRQLYWASTTRPGSTPDAWLTGMMRAPLIVVPHSNRGVYLDRYAAPDKGWDRDEDPWPVPYWHVDAGFASLLMLLGAVDAGLGACFFGIPRDFLATFRGAFGVPQEYTPIGAITVGYPAPGHRSRPRSGRRRPVADVVHRGRWGVSDC
jgi:nitroreductase